MDDIKKTIQTVANQSLDKIEKQRITYWQRNKEKIVTIIIALLMFGISIYLVLDTFAVGSASAIEQFMTTKDEAVEAVYNDFYQKSYEIAEAKHHVSNEISVSVGTLREEEKLEVLKISEVEYVTPDDEAGNLIQNVISAISNLIVSDVVSWLEVPGFGVFTVDLKLAEFIIDDERQYVLIRIPDPELTEFTIDYARVELLNFEDSGLFKNSAQVGEDIAREQLQSAELQLLQKVKENQSFYQEARDSSKKLLENLVKQFNPQLEHLRVEVEFIE